MIGEGPSLVEMLPSRLQEALDRELQSGEKPVVALRGSAPEAMAATAGRLLKLAEGSGALSAATVEAYPLADLSDIAVRETRAGAALTWNVRGRSEPVVFGIPSYDVAKFRMAVNAVRRLLTQSASGAGGSEPAATSRCPKCSAALPAQAAFCPACGLQSRDICWDCGRPLETGWRLCPYCGGDAGEPGVIPCPSCQASVARDYAYCPQCGTAARPTCDECDRVLRRSWQYCPDCGTPVSGESAPGSGAESAASIDQPAPRRGPATPFPEPGDVRPSGSSKEAEALNQRGIEAYERERFNEAIDLFRQALALDPGNPTFHCNLAVACGENGLDDEAFAEYQRTLSLNPSNVTALVNLGYLYSERERYEEARDCWERAVRAAPDSSEAAEARANLQNLEQL
jgi:RNA polymerase subunit RPABC4/transcription elongation factor Spt4